MISIKNINEKDIDLCYELDLKPFRYGARNNGLTNLKKKVQKFLDY